MTFLGSLVTGAGVSKGLPSKSSLAFVPVSFRVSILALAFGRSGGIPGSPGLVDSGVPRVKANLSLSWW